MVRKLSEDDRHKIERPHVTIELTINPQTGMSGVPESLLPVLSTELTQLLATLSERLCDEAEEVADMAEALADRLSGEASDTVVAKHCDTAKVSTDSNGSSLYLRVQITSTKRIPQTRLFQFVDSLLQYFREFVFETIKATESAATTCVDGRRPTSATLASLGTLALSSQKLSALVGTEPRLGDRA